MNMTSIINDIKLLNGLNTLALPFKQPVENVIKEAIQISIRTFSTFKPLKKSEIHCINTLRSPSLADRQRGIYILPPSLTTLAVSDAYATNASSTSPSSIYHHQMDMDTIHTMAAMSKYNSVVTRPSTTKWLGSNKIQLFDFPENAFIEIHVKCLHDENGETIEESCRESFMELANLDVQTVMYNQLKNYNTTGGAFKEIQLKIDDWSGAAQSRKELINTWTQTFHYDDIDELVEFF